MLFEKKNLSINKGYFLFHYLLKLPFFERTLIRKNVKNKKILKEWNSKENFEF
jgi:hypothetical protein